MLGGLCLGLVGSPWLPAQTTALPVGCAALLAALLARPRGSLRAPLGLAWLSCLALAAGIGGAAIGALRIEAIDGGALTASPGSRVALEGYVAAVPRRRDGVVRIQLETARGRVLVEGREPVGELAIGSGLRVGGTAREPGEWERGYLERLGIATIVDARTLTPSGARRGGVAGALDRVRRRAEAALGRGTGAEAAALLRGFILGQDDRIDPRTVEEFKRSGLAHLLAVSGQNVVLLAILVSAMLAGLGVSLRARLLWILLAIAVYVPVAGAGPSIQRAGVMGAAGVVAALASRPRSRWYALGLSAAATLALNPRAASDVGWQLSFAAVSGILVFNEPLRRLLGRPRDGLGAALIDGTAMTLAASVATAPLMALHFGAASLVSLPANLVALPAEAPVMWLGMAVAAAGQLTWLPVEPSTWLAGALAGFIAQVAQWFAAPRWALAEVELAGPGALLGAYIVLCAPLLLAARWRARRRGLGRLGMRRPRLAAIAVAGSLLTVAAGLFASAIGPRPIGGPVQGRASPPLRVTVLDVGQGDAILVEPRAGAPILIDSGPPTVDLPEILRAHGIERLAALVATHPQADHTGGIADLLGRMRVGQLLFARIERSTLAVARAAGVEPVRVAAGDRWRSGAVRFECLWPPPARLAAARSLHPAAAGDANALSLVIHLRWRSFDVLLAGDAEGEVAPVDPGRIEVLKVAHHGSADSGLEALLERAHPRLGLISVGADNPYGHPAPATLASLEDRGVAVLRTDLAGEISVEATKNRWSVR